MPRITTILIFLLIPITATAQTQQPPRFEQNLLIVPSVDTEASAGTFQDVRIEITEQGELKLLDYVDPIPFRFLQEFEILQTDSFPVQATLKITGYESGCLNLGQIRQRRTGNIIELFIYLLNNLAVTNPGEIVCTADVRYFTKYVPLSIYGLDAGNYQYSVNGEIIGEFSLSEFNGY